MKYLAIMILVLGFITPALADFDNGQNENGLYCLETSVECTTVYSLDASVLLHEKSAGEGKQTSAWYMRKRIDSKIFKATEKFWERIAKMKTLRK